MEQFLLKDFFKYGLYFIFNGINIFIIFLCVKTFIIKNDIYNSKIEIISYFLYWFVYSFLYFLIKVPILIMFLNILSLFLLFFNYKINIKNKIILSITIYILFAIIETFCAVIINNASYSMYKVGYINSLEMLLRSFLYFIIFIFIRNLKILKFNIEVPIKLWLPFFIMPIISIISLVYFFTTKVFNIQEILIYFIIIFFLNINMFYLYNIVSKSVKERLEFIFLQEKNNLYVKQVKMISNTLEITRSFKHDLNNHLITVQNLIMLDKKDEVLEYIDKIFNVGKLKNDYINTGNVVIDSILNFKLQQLNDLHIKFDYNILVPNNLDIEDFDLVIILSNILDNAIEANLKDLPIEKFINLKIKFNKGRLLINLSNSFDGILKYKNNKIITKKLNKDGMNGIGLKNIKKVANKYNGLVNINTYKNIFEIDIILFTNSNK